MCVRSTRAHPHTGFMNGLCYKDDRLLGICSSGYETGNLMSAFTSFISCISLFKVKRHYQNDAELIST
jgi:hypothetical protein